MDTKREMTFGLYFSFHWVLVSHVIIKVYENQCVSTTGHENNTKKVILALREVTWLLFQ